MTPSFSVEGEAGQCWVQDLRLLRPILTQRKQVAVPAGNVQSRFIADEALRALLRRSTATGWRKPSSSMRNRRLSVRT